MIFLLDTNAFSDLIRGQVWLDALPEDSEVVTCVIVRGELLHGLERMPEGKRRRQLVESTEELFHVIPCLPVHEPAALHYASGKAGCQRRGLSLDENDLWIAATAMAIDATLISRDSDFSRVEGLSLVHPEHIPELDFADHVTEVPDGRYQVAVENVHLSVVPKISAAPMLRWTLRIVSGTYSGRLLWYTKVISAASMPDVAQDLQICGLSLPLGSEILPHLHKLVGVRLEITKRTKGGRYSTYFERRLL